jgi:hypothetical protein
MQADLHLYAPPEMPKYGEFVKKIPCIKKSAMLNIGTHVNVHSKVSSSGSLFLLGNAENGKG